MGGMNGIQTANELRKLKIMDVQIMFLTSYPEYMVQSFDVMTFQYLIKPIQESVLEEKLIKLHQYFQAMDKKYVVIKSDYDDLMLKYEDILWIEVIKSLTIKNKLKVVTSDHSYETERYFISLCCHAERAWFYADSPIRSYQSNACTQVYGSTSNYAGWNLIAHRSFQNQRSQGYVYQIYDHEGPVR